MLLSDGARCLLTIGQGGAPTTIGDMKLVIVACFGEFGDPWKNMSRTEAGRCS